MKATPMKRLRTARSTVTSSPWRRRWRLSRREPSSTTSTRSANCPDTACDTRLMFVPHARQNCALSVFSAAQLGQNIGNSFREK
jgi:hypothetical protein